ncbi:hypothetical protein CEXT_493881 [Caerostris extrusa]|uniref:Uncharacterized protein n=1 Tax=Caerostris extrusa TaxID=172846 RepID=A0AAV4WM03_CAEEX|nr:hypothetical protein CEXT_493881 [Caerostris extrusa]
MPPNFERLQTITRASKLKEIKKTLSRGICVTSQPIDPKCDGKLIDHEDVKEENVKRAKGKQKEKRKKEEKNERETTKKKAEVHLLLNFQFRVIGVSSNLNASKLKWK